MNYLDSTILDFLNQFSRMSWTVDTTVRFISESNLLKGGVLLTILWWAWFRADERQGSTRVHMISTLIACLIAAPLARGLALSLPFRSRPLNQPALDFVLPYSMTSGVLKDWSTFPSDHAMLFYALSAGMLYISRKLGIFALVYTTLFTALPRVYLGLHYPTDILGGAVMGIAIVVLCNTAPFIKRVSKPIQDWSTSRPALFYPLFFIVTCQIADMFNGIRALARFLFTMFNGILS
jgi:undecaprenyl-diphosphatase